MFINQGFKLSNALEEVGHRGYRSGIWSSVLGANEPGGSAASLSGLGSESGLPVSVLLCSGCFDGH